MHDPFTVEVDSKDVRELLYEDVSHLHCTHHHPIVLRLQHGGYEAVQEGGGGKEEGERDGGRGERRDEDGEREEKAECGKSRVREERGEGGGKREEKRREDRGERKEGEKRDKDEGVRGMGDSKACEHLTYWMYIPGYADLLQDIR